MPTLPDHLNQVLIHIHEEAVKTKPTHYSLLQAIALLIAERHERGILSRSEAVDMFREACFIYFVRM